MKILSKTLQNYWTVSTVLTQYESVYVILVLLFSLFSFCLPALPYPIPFWSYLPLFASFVVVYVNMCVIFVTFPFVCSIVIVNKSTARFTFQCM